MSRRPHPIAPVPDDTARRIGNPKALFRPTSWPHASAGGHPSPAALAAPPARCSHPPERPGARRSTVPHGFGGCWTGAAGWGRGGPLGVLEGWEASYPPTRL
jgi:hypothetical protein